MQYRALLLATALVSPASLSAEGAEARGLSERCISAVVLLDGQPHAPAAVSSWLGDSRFTRVGPNTLHYEVTVDNPQTWRVRGRS